MPTHYRGTPSERRALNAYIALSRSSTTVSRDLSASIRETGLSESQFGALEALLHLGPLAPCDLGEKLLTSRPNITAVVDELERRGLVRRERSQEDRRSLTVHLTPAGERLISSHMPRHVAAVTRRLSALTQREQDQLGRLCKKLGKAGEKRADES